MLVAVAGLGGSGQFGQAIRATARPREDLAVLQARGRAVIASQSPAPARVKVSGPPASPGPGASSYQLARYGKERKAWRAGVAAGWRLAAARTSAATTAWARGLHLSGALAGPRPAAASLTAECARAASVASGLVDQAGSQFGARRVLLLAVASLGGTLPAGELNGDDVIVTTSYLPTSAAASAAQTSLLAAGAANAAVLGPEVTPSQLDRLVSDGLTEQTVTQSLSGPALFGNNSPALRPTAAGVLAPLAGPLSRPGATGIVNGYASAPGSTRHNQALSHARAAAVAAFLEAHGVPKLHLLVVGHGATHLVGPGSSSDNRRVVVVIELPGSS